MPMFGFPAGLVLLALAAATHAPTPGEQKAFTDGLRLFEAGDARGAERVWKTGYALGHDPAFLVRIGEAEEKAGAPQEAVRSYEQYLRDSPDASDRTDIEGRVARLAPPSSGTKPGADVETPREMQLAAPAAPIPSAPASAGAPTHVPATPATAPGASATSAAAPAAPATVLTPAAAARPRQPQAEDDANEDLRPIADGDQRANGRLNAVAWGGAGVTVLLLGVAGFYGASAADKADDANRLLGYSDQATGVPLEYAAHAQQFEKDVRIGQHDDRVAKGFLIAAGVTALVTTVLFIVDSTTGEKPPALRARADGRALRPRAPARQLQKTPGWGLTWTF